MQQRIFGLENEYGLIFSPNGKIYLPMEKVLGYIFEGLIPNSWPSNAFLVNGARFYQDTGCHPEYSTPECDNILDLVIHDKAGERLLEACLPAAEERLREEGLSGEIYIFKNNTDSLGNTYGCHENYLMRRDVDFWKVTEQLIPFFVTRQIYSSRSTSSPNARSTSTKRRPLRRRLRVASSIRETSPMPMRKNIDGSISSWGIPICRSMPPI